MTWGLDFVRRFPPFRHIVDYQSLERELLDYCPACKAKQCKNSILFARSDRYGFPAITNWCRNCDLLYINPRPTPKEYKEFYDTGTYRRLIKAFSGQEDDHLLPQERVQQVVSLMNNHIRQEPLSILNIGGTRADYDILAKHIEISRYVCLNPGETEAGNGYEVWNQSLETYLPKGDVFDVVCLLGTINHLTEPGDAFEKIACMMSQNSIFVFDFKDPLKKMTRMTQPVGGLQFDHATYPTGRTIGLMLKRYGFGLCAWHSDNQRLYTFIAAKSGELVLPEILTSINSNLINMLRLRTGRLPRRLFLQSLSSILR